MLRHTAHFVGFAHQPNVAHHLRKVPLPRTRPDLILFMTSLSARTQFLTENVNRSDTLAAVASGVQVTIGNASLLLAGVSNADIPDISFI